MDKKLFVTKKMSSEQLNFDSEFKSPVSITDLGLFTHNYYPGRVSAGELSIWVCMYVCIYVCVQKTRLFTALLLEDCHEIALNSLVVEYFSNQTVKRRLRSRESLLSRAMAMCSY